MNINLSEFRADLMSIINREAGLAIAHRVAHRLLVVYHHRLSDEELEQAAIVTVQQCKVG